MMKPRLAVHKFTSCDGCQLAILNMGEELLTLADLVDIVHFAEAGPVEPEAQVDIAIVEGSVSTPDELERIKRVRENSNCLITIGACATTGGIQALRNHQDSSQWVSDIYPQAQFIQSLNTSTAIREHVRVDFELWGCPVNSRQVKAMLRSLLFGVSPIDEKSSLCLECKRQQNPCVVVTKQEPCMGPLTRTGCGALCPHFGKACFACYGPSETVNSHSLVKRYQGFGVSKEDMIRRFNHIQNNAAAYKESVINIARNFDE